jgi:anti-anti-sigma factor
MDVNNDSGERYRVVHPTGELDLANAAAFRSSLDGAGPGREVPRLIVDLTQVTFMDVSPLRELRAAQAAAHRPRRRLPPLRHPRRRPRQRPHPHPPPHLTTLDREHAVLREPASDVRGAAAEAVVLTCVA